MSAYFQQARFLQSASSLKTMPPQSGVEVAFVGRSNSGKSSTINRLCMQKSLARTSKTPGRTQLINFFQLTDGSSLVDLPGYGYAKAPQQARLQWQSFIESYFAKRTNLAGLVIVMDIRHPMTDYDQLLLNWAQQHQFATHIVLNKADKLKRGPGMSTLLKIKEMLAQREQAVIELNEVTQAIPHCSVQLFSAQNGQGLAELKEQLMVWFGKVD